jgi:hypothetical protein
MRKFLLPAVIERRSLAVRVQALFAALPPGTPGDCWVMRPPFCWQNAARTVAATAAGHPIRLVDGLGRGLALQALSDAARPTLGGFAGGSTLSAEFNGTSSAMQTVAALDMSSTDEVTVIAVVRASADVTSIIAELGASASLANTFSLTRSVLRYAFSSRGTAIATALVTGSYPANDDALLVARAKISTPISSIARNRATADTSAASQGAGNYGNHLLNIGARNAASLFYNGHIAALCIVGRQPSSLPSTWLETMTGLLVPQDAVFS